MTHSRPRQCSGVLAQHSQTRIAIGKRTIEGVVSQTWLPRIRSYGPRRVHDCHPRSLKRIAVADFVTPGPPRRPPDQVFERPAILVVLHTFVVIRMALRTVVQRRSTIAVAGHASLQSRNEYIRGLPARQRGGVTRRASDGPMSSMTEAHAVEPREAHYRVGVVSTLNYLHRLDHGIPVHAALVFMTIYALAVEQESFRSLHNGS